MATVKKLAIFAAFGVALGGLLWWAGFSERQSVVLIVIILAGAGVVHDYYKVLQIAQRQQYFLPYFVTVQPNWHALLLDYKLVKDNKKYQELPEKSLKRAPIYFTVLRPAYKGDQPSLIYWNSRNEFVTAEDFEEPIEGIQFEDATTKKFFGDLFGWWPKVYFKLGGVGYEIGLVVDKDWWEHICEKGDVGELSKTKADADERTRVVVATLPYEEFYDYHDPERDHKRIQERDELRDKQLSHNGWKRIEHISYFGRRIEHKYFTITHDNI
jgi:hypothetical protein